MFCSNFIFMQYIASTVFCVAYNVGSFVCIACSTFDISKHRAQGSMFARVMPIPGLFLVGIPSFPNCRVPVSSSCRPLSEVFRTEPCQGPRSGIYRAKYPRYSLVRTVFDRVDHPLPWAKFPCSIPPRSEYCPCRKGRR